MPSSEFPRVHWLDSPLRLCLVAELLERDVLALRDAVLATGRHAEDVVACLDPLVRAAVVSRSPRGFKLTSDAAQREELQSAVDERRDRLARERFVRGSVLRGMIGVDPKMHVVFEAIRQVCRLDVPVLVSGETGTGKELVARAVHEIGPRSSKAFEAVNCATIPATLFESHMFGHARGAFTGAAREHDGIFARCDGGTLFLDEIGDLEISNQAKLLRVLQGGTFHRVGESTERRSSFRLVAATHRDLPAMVASGAFREDLYYRINVFSIRVPSLRERLDDLPFLVDDLLRASSARLGATPTISPAAVRVLAEHRWPGNVRELENVLLRSAIAAGSEMIEPQHLPLGSTPNTPRAEVRREGSDGAATLAEIERQHIERIVEREQGNLRSAARVLAISRAKLYRKLKAYGLQPR